MGNNEHFKMTDIMFKNAISNGQAHNGRFVPKAER